MKSRAAAGATQGQLMDDVVALRLDLTDDECGYVLTWGRIQDSVDTGPLEALVSRHAGRFALGAPVRQASVCPSLREPAESDSAPYFYEHLLRLSHHQIPYGRRYRRWRARIDREMQQGRHLYFCGRRWAG